MIHLITFIFKYDSHRSQIIPRSVFNIQEIQTIPNRIPKVRTVGVKNGSKTNDVFIAPKQQIIKPKPLDPFKAQAMMNQTKKVLTKRKVNTRNPIAPTEPALTGIGHQTPTQSVSEVMEDIPSTYAGVVDDSHTLSKTDVNVKVEMPEGVKLSELNEFELMFYTFQKRMMVKYVESIILKVRDFEKTHPHRKIFPEGKHIMTGRVVFDADGNIKQIKMIRWTNVEDLQGIFEEALKSMYSLPNPPKFLWEKKGEFTVFYNFIVNNV